MDTLLTHAFASSRAELCAYLCRLVVRPELAEELLQTTYLRCLEAGDRLPADATGVRAWLFRVASNLAFDALRRHATWRETTLQDLRTFAESNPDFLERSRAMVGTPETKAVAREHLVACIACTLRNLPERKAAAVLLKEVHAFTVAETADILEATPAQAKNWLQEGRALMKARYGTTCALIDKRGVCHQCVELDGFFAAGRGSPLEPGADIDARLAIAASLRDRPWSGWHRIMLELVGDLG
jgi:RNA polymerase sigma-70 factor (ECF subfamily)